MFLGTVSGLKGVGYFGPSEEEFISEGKENASGRLSTLEEYSFTHPLKLV